MSRRISKLLVANDGSFVIIYLIVNVFGACIENDFPEKKPPSINLQSNKDFIQFSLALVPQIFGFSYFRATFALFRRMSKP